ncbi:MAG: hypothetical protein RLZZ339_2810 [Cyanobacteriota bacterium]|jgi:uncharacterized protein with HEPN domain
MNRNLSYLLDYRQINLKQVWLVTQIDIPELLKNLEPLLPKQED